MHFEVKELLDNRFIVEGICNDSGGMGQVLYVKDQHHEFSGTLALKYCRAEDDEHIRRFRREVRLLKEFSGNSKVVDILYSNTESTPPFFVMKFYESGDLTTIIDSLKNNVERQEIVFNQMINCISELHSKDIYHRDIKPANFLIDGKNIVVSDLGFGIEPDSSTRFTKTLTAWGTNGFYPPEFKDGGFKNADKTGDIYMLGKSIYALVTGDNPEFLMDDRVHPALFRIIEKACNYDRKRRYQTLSELKQDLQSAYSVILSRGGPLSEVNQLFSTITDRLKNEHKYNVPKVVDFIGKLALVEQQDQHRICLEIEKPFISILTQEKLIPHIGDFLKVYGSMVENGEYGWAVAEDIATNMRIIFNCTGLDDKSRSIALNIAIQAADRMNRYAAMDTCIAMITSVDNDQLGDHVAAIIQNHQNSFITNIEPVQCKCTSIRSALESMKP